MNIVYFDTETNIKNIGEDAIGNNKASPFHPDNNIVYTGALFENHPLLDGKYIVSRGPVALPIIDENSLLVAQNIAFDLLHLLESEYGGEWMTALEKAKLWDVMLVEYLLTGQELKWASLDELATIYGGELKDSRIKEYWENGIDTEDIPQKEILPYLESDVRNLQIIYKGQLKVAQEKGMLPLIESQMDARLMTIIMEHNGMYFNKTLAHTEKQKLKAVVNDLEEQLVKWMERHTPFLLHRDALNPSSNQQLSAVIFGGIIKQKMRKPVLDEDGNEQVYKSGAKKGEVKTRLEEHIFHLKGLVEPTSKPTKAGYYPVGDEHIKKLKGTAVPVDLILQYRELTKQVNTYFDGYSRLVWPDGLIHGQLNHCQTNTGRLSSSNPNLQNISNKESKA